MKVCEGAAARSSARSAMQGALPKPYTPNPHLELGTVGDVQGADDVAADGLGGGGGERQNRDPRVLLLDDAPQLLILGPEVCAQSDQMDPGRIRV